MHLTYLKKLIIDLLTKNFLNDKLILFSVFNVEVIFKKVFAYR